MMLISLPHNWKEINSFKGRTIRNLQWGGGGGGRAKYKKKYSHKGKLNEKNSCTPINPKKIVMLRPKKFDNEKTFLRLENPTPINIFNGPSLSCI